MSSQDRDRPDRSVAEQRRWGEVKDARHVDNEEAVVAVMLDQRVDGAEATQPVPVVRDIPAGRELVAVTPQRQSARSDPRNHEEPPANGDLPANTTNRARPAHQ